MSLTPWEEYIMMDENNVVVDKENDKKLLLSSNNWSNNSNDNNREIEETQLSKNGEALLSNEIVGSLVEAAKLLGLEENIINGVLEKENLFPLSSIEASNSDKANAKKEEHNARERQRRMELSHSYFSLRSLLPNARRSKKRWSSGTIIDKVVDYIPTLQKEIENMNQKKQKWLKIKENNMSNNERILLGFDQYDHNKNNNNNNNPTISIHQLCKGEVIIQICINQINNNNNNNNNKISNLIEKAEEEGLLIIGASTVSVSDDQRILSSHLHIKLDRSLQEAVDHKSILRKRVISWLC